MATCNKIVMSDPGISARQGRDKRDRLRIVESTASHSPPGLCEDWYSWFDEKDLGETKIFYIDRAITSPFIARSGSWPSRSARRSPEVAINR
jgi:hypothetical protein